jgi:hypothetical protein
MFLVRRPQAESRSRLQRFCGWFKELLGEDHSEARGQELLREWLSPEQLVQFERERHFDVVGCDSGKRYQISYGSSMNIHEVDDTGRPLVCWCLIPDACYIVPGDVMLAQKIALETHEHAALALANRFPPRDERPRRSRAR